MAFQTRIEDNNGAKHILSRPVPHTTQHTHTHYTQPLLMRTHIYTLYRKHQSTAAHMPCSTSHTYTTLHIHRHSHRTNKPTHNSTKALLSRKVRAALRLRQSYGCQPHTLKCVTTAMAAEKASHVCTFR